MTAAEPIVDEVTDCTDCPYSFPSYSLMMIGCAHPDAPEAPECRLASFGKPLDGPPPEWCPLRKAPALVKLAGGVR